MLFNVRNLDNINLSLCLYYFFLLYNIKTFDHNSPIINRRTHIGYISIVTFSNNYNHLTKSVYTSHEVCIHRVYLLRCNDLKLYDYTYIHYPLPPEGPHLHFYIRVLKKERENKVTWLIIFDTFDNVSHVGLFLYFCGGLLCS